MATYDSNWPRWIFASISKHFNDGVNALTPVLPLFIEGQHRNTRTIKDFVELRVDGPKWREVSKSCWFGRVEINVLITSHMDESNYHRIHTTAGDIQNLFQQRIPVYKLGSNPQDDQSFLGCLELIQDLRGIDSLELNHFQQRAADTLIQQATVEGHYKITL